MPQGSNPAWLKPDEQRLRELARELVEEGRHDMAAAVERAADLMRAETDAQIAGYSEIAVAAMALDSAQDSQNSPASASKDDQAGQMPGPGRRTP